MQLQNGNGGRKGVKGIRYAARPVAVQIERNIPIPPAARGHRTTTDPYIDWKSMRVGDSFALPTTAPTDQEATRLRERVSRRFEYFRDKTPEFKKYRLATRISDNKKEVRFWLVQRD